MKLSNNNNTKLILPNLNYFFFQEMNFFFFQVGFLWLEFPDGSLNLEGPDNVFAKFGFQDFDFFLWNMVELG
jgi:hypothetical protein